MTGPLAFSTGTIAAIVAVVVVDLFAIFLGLSIVRSRRAAATAAGGVAVALADIQSSIADTKQPFYFGAGRFYLVGYAGQPDGEVDYVTDGVSAEGLMPLYQRCVHLGCRVPYCGSSGWFECPCHGSKYNGAGEYKQGPAPRGMDRFRIEITEGGDVLVDTSQVILGPPRGTDTLRTGQSGPFCVAPG